LPLNKLDCVSIISSNTKCPRKFVGQIEIFNNLIRSAELVETPGSFNAVLKYI